MAIIDVVVPQLSESVAEATLLSWHKKVGDSVKTINGYFIINSIETENKPTMTFTLKDVEDNANFYAEGVLVHNRPMIGICFVAGTKVTMGDFSEKNIEEVVVGDFVLSFNEPSPNDA